MIVQASPRSAIDERREAYRTALERVLDSGRYILGPEVEAFESEFARFVGTSHAIGVASGTDAVELALLGAGVRAGDNVFTVSLTAGATVAAILRMGATPVLVDVDERTYTLDPVALRAAIRRHGAGAARGAVVPVHLYGAMADMEVISEIARDAGLALVEDCAQAHGASIDGRPAGTWGDAAAFSFYPTKNLAAIGDGGAVVTDHADVAEIVRESRQYGWRTPQVSEHLGMNSRLDEIQAAVLRVGLCHLAGDNERRAAIADRYDRGLPSTRFTTPTRREGARHVYHQYVVRTSARDAFRAWCDQHGVATAVHYPVPVHQQPGYRDRVVIGSALDRTERLSAELVSLPMFPQLTAADVDRVVAVAVSWQA